MMDPQNAAGFRRLTADLGWCRTNRKAILSQRIDSDSIAGRINRCDGTIGMQIAAMGPPAGIQRPSMIEDHTLRRGTMQVLGMV